MKMRSLYLLLISILANGILQAQDAESFFERHGNQPPNLEYETGGAVPSGEDNFLLFYHATKDGTAREELKLDVLSPEGEVLNSTTIEADFDQLAGGIVQVEDGSNWLFAQARLYEEDNFSDLRLLKYEGGTVVAEYTYDNFRYESTTPTMVQSGPNSISFVAGGRDEHYDPDQLYLNTVDVTTGEITASIELTNFDDRFDYLTLTEGTSGVYLLSSTDLADNRLAIVDLNNNTILEDQITIPSNDCSSYVNGLYAVNYLYDEGEQVFRQVNHCLDVYEISLNGEVEVFENLVVDQPFISVTDPIFLRTTDEVEDGLYAYVDTRRFLLRRFGPVYDLLSEETTGFFASEIDGDVINGKTILNSEGDDIRFVSVFEVDSLVIANVPAYDTLIPSTVFVISRSMGFGTNEILIGEETRLGEECKILFYSQGGELLDSIYLGEDVQSSPRGFAILPNGDYVTSFINRTGELHRIDLVSFSRENGLMDTLYTAEHPFILRTLAYQARQGMDGNFYISYTHIDDAGLIRRVVGLEADGSIAFEAGFLNDQFDFSIERPAVDVFGNVYLFVEGENFPTTQLRRYAADGSQTYEVDISHEYDGQIYIASVNLNADGTKLVVGATGTTNGVRENFFYEIDAATGSILRKQLLSNQIGVSLVVQAIYQPGSDNVLVFFNDFKGDGANVNERLSVEMAIYDDTEAIYQEDLLLEYETVFLYDLIVNDNFEAFLTGYVRAGSRNVFESVFIGVDYDAIVSVEEVNDLSETANLNTFPNPAAEQTTISWDNPTTSRYELELVDSQGRRIKRWQGELAVGRASLEVDMSRLPSGTYLLRLTTDGGVSTQRIVRQ